jgi:hypothetical protein
MDTPLLLLLLQIVDGVANKNSTNRKNTKNSALKRKTLPRSLKHINRTHSNPRNTKNKNKTKQKKEEQGLPQKQKQKEEQHLSQKQN